MLIDPPPAHRAGRVLLAVVILVACCVGIVVVAGTGTYDQAVREGTRLIEEVRRTWSS